MSTKTFLAVSFGIIAAVLVLYLAGSAYLTYRAHSDAQDKADRLKDDALMLAAGCAVSDPDAREEAERLLETDLETYENLLQEAGVDSSQVQLSRVALENQLRLKGCFPNPEVRRPRRHR